MLKFLNYYRAITMSQNHSEQNTITEQAHTEQDLLEQEQNNLQQENNSSLLDGVNPIPIVTEFDGDTFEAIGEFIDEVVGGLLDGLSF